jgi:hypothetical protein
MDSSSFAKTVNANSLSVAGALVMRGATFGGDVSLIGAKIGSNLEMHTASFAKVLDADSLSVARTLGMHEATFSGDVSLIGAKIGSNLEMPSSSFAGVVTARGLYVERNLFMDASFVSAVNLLGAKIGGFLSLRGATATNLFLAGTVAREFLLGGLGWRCAGGKTPTVNAAGGPGGGGAPAHWLLGDPAWQRARCDGTDPAILPTLILRNAHVDEFQDSADAWPPLLDLEGFHYDRIGSVGGAGRDDMRQRSPEEWTDWLARDRTFSPQPYTQLATVLLAAGRRETAEAIQFAGRERERNEAWRQGDLRYWGWLTILCYVVGYGIGLYTFSVLIWVVGFTGFGADVLWYSPNARAQGYLWRFGASLHRLLPIVELNKEFKNFFDEPSNLGRSQCRYFAVHALTGWALGLFLLAAMGGLMQKG